MKSEDVGPVPVVSDQDMKHLVGMVTDRDLALKVVAAGRDPNSIRLDEIMSRNIVTCRPDEGIDEAMRKMSDNQVRRIPITENGKLIGIVAQADVARNYHEGAVGDVVEDISQPHGLRGSRAFGRFGSRPSSAHSDFEHEDEYAYEGGGSAAMSACLGLGLGALAMYLFDPNMGRRRRALARDKAVRFYSDTAWAMDKTRKDVQNRAYGVAHQMRSMYSGSNEPVPDHKLVDRIRSRMGRIVSHPHAVHVDARDGEIMLSGDVPANELDHLLKCVRSVPGVTGVDNQLHAHEDTSNVPSLQGGRERPGWRGELMESNWSPTTRLAAGVLAGGVLIAGLGLGRRFTSSESATDVYAVR